MGFSPGLISTTTTLSSRAASAIRQCLVILCAIALTGLGSAMACDGTVRSPDPRAEKALSHADFRDMLEQGEYARLDQLLNAIQEEIEARKRSEFDSCRAYGAFDTSDPTIKAELQGWLSTSPDSVPAHIALGVMYSHLGQ